MSDTERDEEVEEIQPPTQSSHDVMEGDIQTDAIVDVSPAFQELAGKLGFVLGIKSWVRVEPTARTARTNIETIIYCRKYNPLYPELFWMRQRLSKHHYKLYVLEYFISDLQERGVISPFKAAKLRAKYSEAFGLLEEQRKLNEDLLVSAKNATERLEEQRAQLDTSDDVLDDANNDSESADLRSKVRI